MPSFGTHTRLTTEPSLEPDEVRTVECEACWGDAVVVEHKSGTQKGKWWYEAICECGHVTKKDNL